MSDAETDNNLNNDSELDLFELKYLEEISSIFNILKGMDNYYGMELFRDDYYDFYEFIQSHVVIHEFNDDVLSDECLDSEL